MWAARIAEQTNKYLAPLSWWSLMLGIIAMAIITLVVVVDVAMRAIFSLPLHGSIYIIEVMLIIVFFAPYAYCELKKEHVQVNVLFNLFSRRAREIISLSGYMISIGVAVILSWRILSQAAYYKKGNIVTALLNIPEWIFLMMTGAFMAFFVLALFVNLLTQVNELIAQKGSRGYRWLLASAIFPAGLFGFFLHPEWVPLEIHPNLWGIAIFVALFALIFLNVHIGVSMSMISLLGLSYLSGIEAALTNLSTKFIHVASQYTWSVAPLFLWMGTLAYRAGFAKEIYDASYKWFGRLPGGLASASTAACAGLAAITGSSMTGVLTMGELGLPEMRRYKYDMKLATASICTASTIGMLIPPSIGFIVYGMLTEVSIGKLFIAGILPGILFTGILIAMITMMCTFNPKLGPPGPATLWKVKIASLKGVWPVIALVLLVLGGMYGGIITATEAGAIGSFGALVLGATRKRLSFEGLMKSMEEAVRVNGLIMFIFVAATAFSSVIATTQLPYRLAEWVMSLHLSQNAILIVIVVIYMVLGCVMNALPAIILTLPILFPIAMKAGIDPILLGVLVVVLADLGQVTPPIGMNVFAMSAIAKDVPMYSIFRGVLPFWGAFLLLIAILILFPSISLFLPSLMME